MTGGGRAAAAATVILGLATAWGVFLASVPAIREPLGRGDYVAVWGLKARALSRTGEVASLFRVDPEGAFSHPEYPPLWPASLALASGAVAGRYDDLAAGTLWPLLVLSAALLAGRAVHGPPWARVGAAAAVALLPYWRTYVGYAEGLLAVLLLAAVGELDRLERSRAAPLRLTLVLVLACWTKQEGAVAALVISAGLLLAGRRRMGLVAGLASLLLGIAPWLLALSLRGPGLLRADYALRSASPAKLVTASGALLSLAILPNLFWLLGAAALLALAPGVRVRRRGVLLGAAASTALLFGATALTKLDPAWLVRWSWDRLAFLLVAALLPLLAEAAAEPFEARE
ncbi:MAG: hypothetical protein ACHQPI_13550 [Thermoanaerobaculia bacterium]